VILGVQKRDLDAVDPGPPGVVPATRADSRDWVGGAQPQMVERIPSRAATASGFETSPPRKWQDHRPVVGLRARHPASTPRVSSGPGTTGDRGRRFAAAHRAPRPGAPVFPGADPRQMLQVRVAVGTWGKGLSRALAVVGPGARRPASAGSAEVPGAAVEVRDGHGSRVSSSPAQFVGLGGVMPSAISAARGSTGACGTRKCASQVQRAGRGAGPAQRVGRTNVRPRVAIPRPGAGSPAAATAGGGWTR